ncbi:hypothetical protein Q757_10230 [Oenococcus alcoholitolerans]|uniref:ABC transporter domain-containing protein n=1 Tax=Oenococcus alcoholitolerans TaxID=931074 RepID=A0ABR4XNW3_9LACO|nr:hypothetical protein Q757_10230 [Oenococcus alcoholitolerans]
MLKIKNLSKSFDGRKIFTDLDLTVADKEVLSIVGPSGIGKTTLLRIIAGLETADQGTMKVGDQTFDLREERQNSVIGVIFQDFNLFPQFTVLGI